MTYGAIQRFTARHLDGVLAWMAVVGGLVVLAFDVDEGESSSSVALLVAVLVAGAGLAVHRRAPIPVTAGIALLRVVIGIDTGNEALFPALALALFLLTWRGDRRRDLVAAVAIAVLGAVGSAAFDDEEPFVLEFLAESAQSLLPIAVADAWRARVARINDRVDVEAAARVQAERLRIARDLHDVVAHSLSTIAIQSGVASHLLDDDPTQARGALDAINDASRGALNELRTMVGALRSEPESPRQPTPGGSFDLDAATAIASTAGIPLSVEISGEFPDDVPDSVVVAVHRIVGEALTNVARHAGAVPTGLKLTHGPEALSIEIVNEPSSDHRSSGASTGVGIVGMTERAVALGGELAAGPTPEGGFSVTASIPYYRRSP